MDDLYEDAYEQGYYAGYYDELVDNPYDTSTREYLEWDDGYADGLKNA